MSESSYSSSSEGTDDDATVKPKRAVDQMSDTEQEQMLLDINRHHASDLLAGRLSSRGRGQLEKYLGPSYTVSVDHTTMHMKNSIDSLISGDVDKAIGDLEQAKEAMSWLQGDSKLRDKDESELERNDYNWYGTTKGDVFTTKPLSRSQVIQTPSGWAGVGEFKGLATYDAKKHAMVYTSPLSGAPSFGRNESGCSVIRHGDWWFDGSPRKPAAPSTNRSQPQVSVGARATGHSMGGTDWDPQRVSGGNVSIPPSTHPRSVQNAAGTRTEIPPTRVNTHTRNVNPSHSGTSVNNSRTRGVDTRSVQVPDNVEHENGSVVYNRGPIPEPWQSEPAHHFGHPFQSQADLTRA